MPAAHRSNLPVVPYARLVAIPEHNDGVAIMSAYLWTIGALSWFLLQAAVADDKSPDPLFQSDEVLTVRIAAPMATLLSKRPDEEELPARFHYIASDGSTVELDIEIRTRGRFRRRDDVCRFPPLRLDFKTSEVKKTLFHKQDKLKLVTHCEASSRYEQALLREYLAYRIQNVLTDISYKVRLMRITYVDTERKHKDVTQHGFVIEHKDRFSKRIGAKPLDIPKTSVRALDPKYTNLSSVYQYMIGNTDFSPIRAAPGEFCCHNFELYGNEGEAILAVPYDFDQSGLVDAPHAIPNEQFRIRSVRQRLYRGRCANNKHLPSTFTLFLDRRDDVYAAINSLELVSKSSLKTMIKYIDGFYEVITSEGSIDKKLVKACI